MPPPAPRKLWFDGGCRPNPGRMEIAVVTGGRTWIVPDCGVGDSNRAEWLALLGAMDLARQLGETDVVFCGDSAFVIDQIAGRTAAHPATADCLAAYRNDLVSFSRVRVRHVGRAQNLAGIALEYRRAGLAPPQPLADQQGLRLFPRMA
ncbi:MULTISPECIES: reverse transcriptase-like protein [unclassified Novosphingobium]|uniref:reverse transcriptase-like protein n=1 Tax=unclassified Novosphingobium TaxID=2644732 RepID=UPI0017BA32FB|nr:MULTISPECIES: reverse transcriptase-like protein [unclassified Novosphingobium]MBB3358379.1 ribonuclease HI [Novosphingobium sp. BK256]MBB3374740.1 ribonuclease HI [Novosphingobium sp. BK280]MBB3379571.1 ribonuclease HI [Novosphingobium sp. BK258]MBB3421266.1 ribonuclease HI [Novosphingobium sp. BK267]MBB3449161.1 ribonuclease HI [Novosphingobium sp. BK352]